MPGEEVVLVVEDPDVELEEVVSVPETALAVAADMLTVAADTLELLVVPLATVSPPAEAELAAAVAPAEAGQDAADGNFTLTLCTIVVSKLNGLHLLRAATSL